MWRSLFQKHRKESLYLLTILLVTAVLLGLMLNRFLTVVNHDSAIFCILAQSLLKGNYLLTSEPNPQPYFTFPPFLSLQLAGLMRLFQNTDPQAMQLVFKGYINLLFLASLPLFYLWLRQMRGSVTAMALTALVAVNSIIFKYSSDILSDVPYWAFSMAAILACWLFQEQLQQYKEMNASSQASSSMTGAAFGDVRSTRYPWGWFALSVLMIILCALTRQIGMALILAFLLTLLAQKQWKVLLLSLLLFAGTVGVWQGYEHQYRSAHRSDIDSLNQQGVQEVLDRSPIKLEYVKHFLVDRPVDKDQNRLQTSPWVLLGNIRDRIIFYTHTSLDQLIPRLRLPVNGLKVTVTHFWPFMLLVWALFLPGLWQLGRRFLFGGLYLALYMGVLLVYPYTSPRFLLPVFPLIVVCVFLSVLSLKSWLEKRASASEKHASKTGLPVKAMSRVLIPAFIVLSLLAQLPETLRWVSAGYKLKVANQGPSLRRGNAAYYRTLLWIRENTPEKSLIISRKPPVTYFYSGRPSTAFPFTAHQDELFAYIEDKKTRYGTTYSHIYIFEDNVFGSSTRYLKPALEKHQDRLQLVYTEPTTQSRVWRLK